MRYIVQTAGIKCQQQYFYLIKSNIDNISRNLMTDENQQV